MIQIYTYKNKEYTIFKHTKAKVFGVWQDAIMYHCEYNNPDGQYWVRSTKEFFKLFKKEQ